MDTAMNAYVHSRKERLIRELIGKIGTSVPQAEEIWTDASPGDCAGQDGIEGVLIWPDLWLSCRRLSFVPDIYSVAPPTIPDSFCGALTSSINSLETAVPQ